MEDVKLGLDLALAGKPAVFCPSAGVTSNFPSSLSRASKVSGCVGSKVTSE